MTTSEAPTAEVEPTDDANEEAPASLWVAGIWGIALLSVLFAWWGWQEGAYFGRILLIGSIVLAAAIIVLARVAPWPLDLSRSRAVAVTLGALVLLGAWSIASALWSPAPDTAVGDGQRILTYALLFGCGLWFTGLLGRRVELALIPLAVAGAFAGAVTVYVLLTGNDVKSVVDEDATLLYSMGYRNANAAFFAIGFLPALTLASLRTIDWRIRGAATATATLCLSLFFFTQSRASLPALVVAGIVFLLLAPRRVPTLIWALLAILPALAAIPAAVALHGAGSEPLSMAVDELRGAGRAALLATVASLVIGSVAALLEKRVPGVGGNPTRGNRIVLAAMALVAVAGAVTFVAKVGNPVTWAGDRIDEFKNEGQPDLRNRSTRYTFNVGSGRYDIWRVALDEARDEPLLGTGGGGFQYAYMQKRDSGADLRDAHSIELENLSELGVPGLALLLAAIGGAFVGAWRSRRVGPGPAALSAAAIATGTYWVAHSSVDWFWAYPSISGATLAMLGAACAPAALAMGERRRRPWRIAAVVAAGVLAISAVPPMLSEYYVNAAYEGWKADLSRAYQDLNRARTLNPLSEEPLLAEGAIAKAAGEKSRALSAFEEAADKRPEEWAAHYYVAALSADDDRQLARSEIRTALNLDPNTFAVRKLARRLGIKPPPLSYEP